MILLQERFPEIEGVSCGAILSNYQRDRVENVCSRLQLVSLTFLWQKEQRQLLREMIDFGIHAVLVKVAAAGLEPYKHLSKSLSALERYFLQLNDRFGFHVCGEGGEYETLVLDCPIYRKRLALDETSVVICGDDASVGLLTITSHSTVPHQDTTSCVKQLEKQKLCEPQIGRASCRERVL